MKRYLVLPVTLLLLAVALVMAAGDEPVCAYTVQAAAIGDAADHVAALTGAALAH